MIESPFATVRLRQRVTKGAGSRTKGLLMAIATPGGKERTRREFEALFDSVGFRLEAVVPTRSPMSVIEAVAR